MTLWVSSDTVDAYCHILEAQKQDAGLQKWFAKVVTKDSEEWNIGFYGRLKSKGQLCVLDMEALRKDILGKAHKSHLTVHLGSTKMYQNLKRHSTYNFHNYI